MADFQTTCNLVAGRWVCPHCGFNNLIRQHPTAVEALIRYCDVEEGGCDRPSIVRAVARLDTYVTKIEGIA